MMPVPRLDLKLRLSLRVAALATLCFAAAATYSLVASGRAARSQADRIVDVLARDLDLQQGQSHWIRGVASPFPDLQRIAPALMAPGLCMAYRAPDGAVAPRLCSGVAPEDADVPAPFTALYRALFGAGYETVRTVVYDGEPHGAALVSIDGQSLAAASWRETSRLMTVMAIVLAGLCILVYAALARALAPAATIRIGLARLAEGDLSTRLPSFDLAELSDVGTVFNQLAAGLETTLAQRNALTRQLIAVQDDERRHLARELHDEFGQCLAAIQAVAASIGETARQACPVLVPESASIVRTAAQMMEGLRGALLRLRPPDVEELGLAASLEGLVAGWNGRGIGPRFMLAISGPVDDVPADHAASLYRIAQEAMTNAAKHARASRVVLRLAMIHPAHAGGAPSVALVVEDDGAAGSGGGLGAGLGLLGMRERVAALGGSLCFETYDPVGHALRAEIPARSVKPQGCMARDAA